MLDLSNKKTKQIPNFFHNGLDQNNTYIPSKYNISVNEVPSDKTRISEGEHYPPVSEEWVDSVYSYNKSFVKTLLTARNTIDSLIKSYFSMDTLHKGKRSKRVQIRFKRLSLNNILTSKANVKHTNNKIIITVYLYNKSKKFFIYKLKSLYKTFISSSLNANKISKETMHNTSTKKSLYNAHMSKKNLYMAKKDTTNKVNKVHYKSQMKKIKVLSRRQIPSLIHKKTMYNNIDFSNYTKKRLSRFFSIVRNIDLKNKYKVLVKNHYSRLVNYRLYSINNELNYYLNFVSLPKSNNYNQMFNTSNFYKLIKENSSSYFNTKRNSITFKPVSLYLRKSANLRKNAKKTNTLMYKLSSLHNLFSLYNDHIYKNNPFSYIPLKKDNSFSLFNNIYKILSDLFISESKRKIKLTWLKSDRIIKKARKHKNFLFAILKWDNDSFINYENKYYKRFINKVYRKEILYLYYTRMLSLNSNKFKSWFLLGLKKIISNIYNKKVEFNFVNLKYIHLNSDIFLNSIAVKLRNRQNRLLKVLKKSLTLVKLPSIRKLSLYSNNIKEDLVSNYKNPSLSLSNNELFENKDMLHAKLKTLFSKDSISSIYSQNLAYLQKNVLNSIKHKDIFGVRLEAGGRLSRRLTASRSVFKLKYKGSLKNIDSSYKGMSSAILRGNTKANIQYTKISSKTRNGSFGLKGWVSSN